MNLFITGASGFVGNALVKHLSSQHQIYALSRSQSSDQIIKEAGATPIKGELGSVNQSDLKNIDVIVHSAAMVGPFGSVDEFMKVNVAGTEQLLEVAKLAGVSRFIHIGTEASVFYGQNMINIDESEPLAFNSPYAYSSSKAYAEKAVFDANDPANNFNCISIRPRLVWGVGDKNILPTLETMIEQGKFKWLDNGQSKICTTHVTNLVHAIELGLTKGEAGEAYFVTDDEPMTTKHFLSKLIETKNITVPTGSAPGALVSFIAKASEWIWHTFRLKSEPPFSQFVIDISRRECTINIDKAKKVLGYLPVISVNEGLQKLSKSNG